MGSLRQPVLQVSWLPQQRNLGASFHVPKQKQQRSEGDQLAAFLLRSLAFPSHPHAAAHTGSNASFSSQRQEECQECKCLPRCWSRQVRRGHCSRPAWWLRLQRRPRVEQTASHETRVDPIPRENNHSG